MPQRFVKDPDAVLDFKFDWKAATNQSNTALSDWLGSVETISSRTVTADSGITVDSSNITDTNTSVTVCLSGGTVGTVYSVMCEIVTSAGRTDERTIYVTVRER